MIKYFEPNEVDDSLISFAIIISKYNNKWILCKHKERDTWEFPAGTREVNESIDTTATRELYEETGAINFTIERKFCFEANNIYGMVYYANVTELESLPYSEIEKIRIFETLDVSWTYPDIQPQLVPHLLSLK